ncbi:hypothetical protein KIW84_043825 [Lathyrus oleraceus]|uniref:Uncharacterized protein n=1 Tax=Pisum sativum TaxID=3888 RepID=A0A9D4XGB2_PEA|nr:hypothetical protein KIW84_043825 [Pisum sativum]
MASISSISSPNLTFPKQNLPVTFPLKRPSLLHFPSQPLCLCLNSVSDGNHNNTNNNDRRWDSMLHEFVTGAMKQFESYFNALMKGRTADEDRGDVNDEDWDWNQWRQHFDEVDDQERIVIILKSQLRHAVYVEDYEEASRLQVAIAAASNNDSVGKVISLLKRAIKEERYHDAAFLRDKAGAGLFVEIVLEVHATPQYPKEPPSVAIVDCKGLDQHRQKHLLNHIQTKANELSPGLMLVALCEEAVEKLSDMNHPDGDCPLCLFPLVTEEHQSETLPFMKLMSCFHCFHSECIIRWWNWLESSKQTGSSKSDNATARRNRAVVLAGGGHSANGAVAQGSQSEGDSNNTTIFVGGLDSEISDEDLRQPFLQYGDVVSVKIPIGKGCGFVQLADRKNAEEAIQGLNGTVIGKQTVRLSWGRSPGNKHWRNNDSNGNHYGGQGYGGHGYGGHGYAVRQNQDIAMQQPAAAIQGAS